jgi:hypothetical protein
MGMGPGVGGRRDNGRDKGIVCCFGRCGILVISWGFGFLRWDVSW